MIPMFSSMVSSYVDAAAVAVYTVIVYVMISVVVAEDYCNASDIACYCSAILLFVVSVSVSVIDLNEYYNYHHLWTTHHRRRNNRRRLMLLLMMHPQD